MKIIPFLFLIPFNLFSQVEWTSFQVHILETNLEFRSLEINFPGEVCEVEFDRLVEGSVFIYNERNELILKHSGLSIECQQIYKGLRLKNKIKIYLETNEVFWLELKKCNN